MAGHSRHQLRPPSPGDKIAVATQFGPVARIGKRWTSRQTEYAQPDGCDLNDNPYLARILQDEAGMIPFRDIFESHLTVTSLERSMNFYGQSLELELATVLWERRVAFYWIGGRGNSMLGLWEVGTGPQRMSLHLAFRVDLEHLLAAAVPPSCRQHCSSRL